MKKALHTAKVVCKVLMFNASCITVFCFLIPVLVFLDILRSIFSNVESCYSALKEENMKLRDELYPQPSKTEIQLPKYNHNSIGLN
jgi:hypothetical protein